MYIQIYRNKFRFFKVLSEIEIGYFRFQYFGYFEFEFGYFVFGKLCPGLSLEERVTFSNLVIS